MNYPRLIHRIFPITYRSKPEMKRAASTWFPWIINFRSLKDRNNQSLMNHEIIHHYQMLDFVLPTIICILLGLKWWIVVAVLFGQPITHLINYLALLITSRKLDYAYRNTAFEREAYGRMEDLQYLKKRVPFSWIKYLV